MSFLTMLLLVPALFVVIGASSKSEFEKTDYATVEVLVTAGLEPLPGASVALDLNNNGVWEDHLGEPRDWTDGNGVVAFSQVASIENPGGDGPDDVIDWNPTRIMMGNLRGTIGSPDMQFDFVLPPGSSTANLGLYDLRGRRIAQSSGTGNLSLNMLRGLPYGVYFLRLSAEPAAPVSQRITSAGVRTQTFRATRVSAAEAVAAGWTDYRPADQGKSRKSDDPQQDINLIVEHDDYLTVMQPEIIEPGINFFTVVLGPVVPEGFVYIPPGTFVMGSPEDEPGHETIEGPQHQVTLTKGFYMSKYEVTEAWWHQVMGGTPTSSQLPKSHVSWDMAVQFCNALSIQEGLTPAYAIHGPNGDVSWNQGANGYRLPTEAEWEYACRATTTMAYHNDTNCLSSDTEANFYGFRSQLPGCPLGVYRGERTVVGSFPANQWGLYDMHGNLLEWVWCETRAYTNSPQEDPVHNADPGAYRGMRGGYWNYYARRCRSASRGGYGPDFVYHVVGFRPVRTVFESP